MITIDALNYSFVKITKLSTKNRKKMTKWFSEQNILVQADIFQEQKNQYFKLQSTHKDMSNSFIALLAFYLAIGQFHQLNVKAFRKNKDYNLSTTKKKSDFNRKKSRRPKLFKKREFLLDIWSVIQEKKADCISDRNISEDLLYDFDFKVSHTYINNLWKEIEND